MGVINEKEVGILIENIINDFKGGKNIDVESVADVLNKPDKSEIIELVNKLLGEADAAKNQLLRLCSRDISETRLLRLLILIRVIL